MRANLLKHLFSRGDDLVRGTFQNKNIGQYAGDLRKFLVPDGTTAGGLALRGLPDVAFGVLAGATAGPEADFIDRLLIGGTQAAGGLGGGLVAGGLARRIPGVKVGSAVENLADMAGSIAGDMGAMNVGLGATRVYDMAKGGAGTDPYQRMSAQQQAELERAIAQRLMGGYGTIPGTHHDQFLGPEGLA